MIITNPVLLLPLLSIGLRRSNRARVRGPERRRGGAGADVVEPQGRSGDGGVERVGGVMMTMTATAAVAPIALLLVGAVLRRLRQGAPPDRDGRDLAELGLGGALRRRRRRRRRRYIVGGCGRGGHAIVVVDRTASTRLIFSLFSLHCGVWWGTAMGEWLLLW